MSINDPRNPRAFYDLCALLFTILRSPPGSGPPPPRNQAVMRSELWNQVSPAALVLLLLGASFALMVCGSVTFVIGIMLMPWVFAVVMAFYFVGIVSSLSRLGRAMICPQMIPGRLFSEIPYIYIEREATMD